MNAEDSDRTAEIGGLLRRISAKREAIRLADQETKAAMCRRDDAQVSLRALEDRLRVLTDESKAPTLTDHAVLRYLERVQGVDVGAARASILPPTVVEMIQKLGSGVYPVGSFRIKVVKGSVVTVLTRDE